MGNGVYRERFDRQRPADSFVNAMAILINIVQRHLQETTTIFKVVLNLNKLCYRDVKAEFWEHARSSVHDAHVRRTF